ncbi:MAG: DNA mismatch repair protein MutL, partial [Planctomycetota bacterium]|nr:DNA mismatch repair protein MutL [Planctomycetota bacterium]
LAVQALPARLRQVDCEGLVRDIIELLAARGRTPVAEELLEEVLHRAACRASVMSGDELNEDEIRSLLRRAREAGHDQTCPHARPTRVRFTRADLDRAFHRR